MAQEDGVSKVGSGEGDLHEMTLYPAEMVVPLEKPVILDKDEL